MPSEVWSVLIVDDDAVVGKVIKRGLRGHTAVVETDARVALRRLHEGERFDVVVCDANMPGLSGHELIASARQLYDPPIFVLMSGAYVSDPNADAVLLKPFTSPMLLELLMALSRSRATALTQPLPRSGVA